MDGDYDILLVGGGLVGASLARGLIGSRLRLAVVEAVPPATQARPGHDDRVIALSWTSRRILEALGCWADLAADAEPILRVHISERGQWGMARLDQADAGVPALGYVVTARALGQALWVGLEGRSDLDWLSPAELEAFEVQPEGVEARLRIRGEPRRLRARLLVAADGGASRVRQTLGVPLWERDYGQTAVIANLTPSRPHGGMAYERFTPQGPLALLPMTEGRCSLVWTQPTEAVEEVLGLADGPFLNRLQATFGFRLGRLTQVGRRAAYPLRLAQARETVRPRVALIGNAAHTLHPVAGQGFNLGLRDVAALAEVLGDAQGLGEDPGGLSVLERYAAWRQADQDGTARLTDGLARLFRNPLAPVRLGRALGLLALDLTPPAKYLLGRQFMGLRGRLPRLARGIPLVQHPV